MHGTDNILSEKKKEIRELYLEEICIFTGLEEQSKWLFKVHKGLFIIYLCSVLTEYPEQGTGFTNESDSLCPLEFSLRRLSKPRN